MVSSLCTAPAYTVNFSLFVNCASNEVTELSYIPPAKPGLGSGVGQILCSTIFLRLPKSPSAWTVPYVRCTSNYPETC